ncbi:MAG: hypothetical protein HYT15_05180 [Candidatus Magasanikbacteria bacterium]|nr:hypothetical protein [Candidatus Magasanikbacteria bacterium]
MDSKKLSSLRGNEVMMKKTLLALVALVACAHNDPLPQRVVENRLGCEAHEEALPFSSAQVAASYKYTVVADTAIPHCPIKNMEFVQILADGEEEDTALFFARALMVGANIGLAQGKYLEEHQTELPSKLRGKDIILTRTLLHNSEGVLSYAVLRWDNVFSDGWSLRFFYFNDSVDSDARVVRCRF